MGREQTGFFSGTHQAICAVLGIAEARLLDHPDSHIATAQRPRAGQDIVDLIDHLYRLLSGNLKNPDKSDRNWRWRDPQDVVDDENDSPEVLLEKAVAMLAKRGMLPNWSNQVPVASGFLEPGNRRAAIDLVCVEKNRLDLYELKWESNTPLYAAFEILLYGLSYVACRKDPTRFRKAELLAIDVSHIGINVIAPKHYYNAPPVAWLEHAIDRGFHLLTQRELGIDASFQFLAMNLGPKRLFTKGNETKAACIGDPVSPEAETLLQCLANMQPAYRREIIGQATSISTI